MIIQRELYQQIKLYLSSKQAIVITGMRRVGKTTLLKFIYDQIESENKLYLDLEDPLKQKYFEKDDFERIKSNLEAIGLDLEQRAFLFLDEIQVIKNIPQIIKYLGDHYKIKFFLTGSASFYLKNLFSESLVGRKFIFELFPFNFREFLELKQAKLKTSFGREKASESVYKTIMRYYQEYLTYGGFPEVIIASSIKKKKKVLEDIFSSYFQFEIKQLADFRKLSKMRDLILLFLSRVGNKLDVQKISQELDLSRPTVYEYIDFLEGTYFIKLVRPFSKSQDVEIRKMPKLYVCDSGIANKSASLDEGTLFEQGIFQLLRSKGKINYYQKKSGAEIDFILDESKGYEVKINPTSSDFKKAKRLAEEIGLDSVRVVSYNYTDLPAAIYGFEI